MNLIEPDHKENAGTTIAFRQDVSTFELMGDRYVVEILDVSSITDSGILIPDDSSVRHWEAARILVVGDGYNYDYDREAKMNRKVGDIVCIERMAGRQVEFAGKPYRIVKQMYVFGRFTVDDK